MPLFEYRCKKCNEQNEVLVRGAETPVCPDCGSSDVVKQASAFATVTPSAAPSMPSCPSAGTCGQAGGGCPYS